MDRRGFLIGISAGAVAACGKSASKSENHSKRMAITMDDFNQRFDIRVSRETRDQNILDAFDAVGLKAAGFVTGTMVNSEWGKSLLDYWARRGHLIENHTWTHPHANRTGSDDYLKNVLENTRFLNAEKKNPTYFRFPYLDDGKDRAQQEALFSGVQAQGLLNAPVTIDTIDWFTNSRLEARLRENPNADLTPYRDYYLTKCLKLANYWDETARALGYVNLPHLTLMHHNILNGLFLKDLLLAFKAEGWQFVDAAEALAYAPYHAIPPEPTHGRSWLTLKNAAAGLAHLPFPEEYRGFGAKTMDGLGL